MLDGVPPGLPLDRELIQRDLDRRRPGQSHLTTPRAEKDGVRLLSGVFEGLTTGAPIAMLIENQDVRSHDYDGIKDTFRPGHADWTYEQKFGIRDYRGGGRASGRETAGRVAGGAIARLILKQVGVSIQGVTCAIAGIKADLAASDWTKAEDNLLRCPDQNAAEEMEAAILEAKTAGDSVGGIIEVHARGVPPGLGEPVFDKLEARIAAAIMSIGAIKGVEFGDGFALANMRGSGSNDHIEPPGRFVTNHAGGILGGISNGAD
ncbi:MAG: chorismate synthase, partial [Deltaproteobacteria bacterium RIFOXYB12_FULL_58_9]